MCKRKLQRCKNAQAEHICGEWTCPCCKQVVSDENHLCYLQKESPKEPGYKYIFYDFECTQDSGEHTPNLVVAHVTCKQCINEDDIHKQCICGSRCSICQVRDAKTHKYVNKPCEDCGHRETYFRGRDTLNEFGKWLFHERHRGYTAIAHNSKAYDGILLQRYMFDNGIKHEVIYTGSKLMYAKVQNGLNMRLIDSINFISLPLSKLPAAFGLHGEKKGDFPHLFNTWSNQNYVGKYPSIECYAPEYKSPDARTKFLAWYETVKNGEFDFAKEILEYCKSDVRILRLACLQFRKLMMEVTGDTDSIDNLERDDTTASGIDPFKHITLASVCMHIYRTKYYYSDGDKDGENGDIHIGVSDTNDGARDGYNDNVGVQSVAAKFMPIAQIPTQGYVKYRQYSKVSIQWLEWLLEDGRRKNEIKSIRHALNHALGEYHIPGTNYKADGFDEASNTIYLFHG